MTLFERIFGKRQNSAEKAKNRLKMILQDERLKCSLPYIDDLKKDLEETINKYTQVNRIEIKTEKNQNIDLLEIEISLNK